MKVSIPLAALVLFAGSAPAVADSPSSRPNIIFVLADDLGLDGVSCYGADSHQTPHIDALAAVGHPFSDLLRLAAVRAVALPADEWAVRFRTGGLTNQSWRAGGPGAKVGHEYPMAR